MSTDQKEKQPTSKRDLIKDLQNIGIKKGMNLMVHSSLSKIGWVIGGTQTVISALIESVGDEGTIVMPAATPYCLHPNSWDDLKIPKDWIPKIEEHLPVFDVNNTPTSMGAISETFRNWSKTLRSDHPISSICARGKLAREVTENHNLEISEGKDTPYEKIYVLGFSILLLGVGFNRCTMLHFAESKSTNRRLTTSTYPIVNNNKREWIKVQDMGNDNSTHFPKIGKQYLKENETRISKIGEADSILLPTKTIVDFAANYFDNR
jgi:aminoglycoside 3-N-acetyltransferase